MRTHRPEGPRTHPREEVRIRLGEARTHPPEEPRPREAHTLLREEPRPIRPLEEPLCLRAGRRPIHHCLGVHPIHLADSCNLLSCATHLRGPVVLRLLSSKLPGGCVRSRSRWGGEVSTIKLPP